MTQALRQQRRVDFLRHIVNRVLASSNVPQQLIEDVKKLIGRAEDRYKFDAFSGNVKNLAEYLRSTEFNDLINVMKSSPGGLEILKKILEEAKKAYSDIPEIAEAIDKRLKEIGGEETPRKRYESPLIRRISEKLEKKGFRVISVNEKESFIEASKDNIRLKIIGIRTKNSKITVDALEVNGLVAVNEDELIDRITKITA